MKIILVITIKNASLIEDNLYLLILKKNERFLHFMKK